MVVLVLAGIITYCANRTFVLLMSLKLTVKYQVMRVISACYTRIVLSWYASVFVYV